jgi:hypothetical protein
LELGALGVFGADRFTGDFKAGVLDVVRLDGDGDVSERLN